jgi:hypothetical protein
MPATTITAHNVRGLVVCEGCAHLDALRSFIAPTTSPMPTPIRIDNRTLAHSGNVLACGHCSEDIALMDFQGIYL